MIVEGLLNVFWGVRRPIRLQMQDEKEADRPRPSLTSTIDDDTTVGSELAAYTHLHYFFAVTVTLGVVKLYCIKGLLILCDNLLLFYYYF